MSNKRSKGGNVTPAEAAARVDIAEKCALVAVPVPNAPAKPKPFKAETIHEAIEELGVGFKVNLRRQDGTTSRETISIQSLDDFEEPAIVRKSPVLRELKRQMEFLHEFQNELRHNPVFRQELMDFIQEGKREQFVQFLKGWTQQLKKPSSQFLELLRS